MAHNAASFSKVTSKFQTTIPLPIRKTLGIAASNRVFFEIDGDRVVLTKLPDFDWDYLEVVSGTLGEWASTTAVGSLRSTREDLEVFGYR